MASACSVAVASDSKVIGPDFIRTPASTCVLVTVSLICTCFLVVCGVLVVREYSLAIAYEETQCHLKNFTYTKKDVSCVFCSGFKDKSREKGPNACIQSYFPCVRMIVTYLHGNNEQEAILHPDSLQASGPYHQCSYSICLKTKEENQKAVQGFVDEVTNLASEESFPCFFDMEALDSVIAQKMYTKSDVVHTMLWPSLVVLACGIIFLRLEMRRRRLTMCGRKPSLDDPLDSMDRHHDTADWSSQTLTCVDSIPPRKKYDGKNSPQIGSSWSAQRKSDNCVYKSLPALHAVSGSSDHCDSRAQVHLKHSTLNKSVSVDRYSHIPEGS